MEPYFFVNESKQALKYLGSAAIMLRTDFSGIPLAVIIFILSSLACLRYSLVIS